MNFFAFQEQARRRTGELVFYYGLAVAMIVVVIYFVLGFAFGRFHSEEGELITLWVPELFAMTAVAVVAVIGIGTLYQVFALSSGGTAVAEMLGGRLVTAETRDPLERRYLNVVEEMALASGVPIPKIYVLDDETGINAFAAGYKPTDAVVAVTRGSLETLNRDELQGVVAHEFSHILNGDMRLNIRLIGILGGILGLSVVGRVIMELAFRAMRSSGRRSGKKNDGAAVALAFAALGLAVWIIGSVGAFFGRLLQSAVSRQREFLADASATQFTRNPDALASALKIIGATPDGARVKAGHAGEVSHMLFASGMASLFATHPPLLARIQRLDPSFDGDFAAVQRLLQRRLEERHSQTLGESDDTDGVHEALLAGTAVARQALHSAHRPSDGPPPPPLPPSHGYGAARAASPPSRSASDSALAWLATDERIALRRPDAAICCIYAALLGPKDSDLRSRQLDSITAAHGAKGNDFARAAEGWQERHANWTPRQRRMVCELAAENLRNLPDSTRKTVVAQIEALSTLDQRVDDFEFALGHLVRRRLLPVPEAVRLPSLRPDRLAPEASLILSALAHAGHADPVAVQAAWETGIAGFADSTSGATLFPGLEPVASGLDDLAAIEAAFEKLIRLAPLCKREFLNGCMRIIRHDGRVTDTEENYVAAIADAIHAYGWQTAA